jgi:hypothetical protein
MALEGFSELVSAISLENVLNGDLSAIVPILYLVVSIAIYSILIWHFYRFVARRDSFKFTTRKHPKVVGFLKYFFMYPFVAFLFFAGFSLMLLFLTRTLEITEVLTASFAIIAAIRVAAYYNEDLSKDVAKMLPFALLGVTLVEPSYFVFGDVIDKIYSMPEFFTVCIQFILLIVLMEWILRIALTIRTELKNINRKNEKIEHHYRPNLDI